MEINSSSLDVTIRTRKPYTITKQRERWTVEEHNRFLEALKLYGRSWQRIEEHIGTKTAVQIRSHAQKFFSKLEREASAKGLQTEDAHEIKIPPPRPKRKPNNPYPRKMVSSCPVSSILPGQIVLNIESPVKGCTETEASISKEYLLEARRPEILALFEEAPCVSPSSQSNIDKPVRGTQPHSSLRAFREFMTPNYDAKDEPPMKLEINCNNVEIDLEIGSLFKSESSSVTIRSTNKICEENEVHESGKLGDPEFLQNGKAPSSQGYPRHVPVHVVDTSITKPSEIHSPLVNCNDFRANKYFSNTAHHPLYTAFPMLHHSFNTFPTNPETFKSAAAYVSFTLSNFIISSLVQNPAATIATSLCPYTTGLDDCPDEVGKPDKNGIAYVEPCADPAAVAAATVNAASAWWNSQGLIPICHPQVNFPSVVTPFVAVVPVTGSTPCLNSNREEEKKAIDSREPELSQVNDGTCPASESPPLLSAESDASACGGLGSSKVIVKSHEQRKHLASDFFEIGKTNARMKQYRSSCGSNTTSSSERETDNVSEDVKGASETLNPIHTFEELANRRSRNTRNNNDSWKEVSDEVFCYS